MTEKVMEIVEHLMSSHCTLSKKEKRSKLNGLEKRYPQNLFIKTHLCKSCDELDVEVWIKVGTFTYIN